jgi:archaetidylinositol phosphate synthase
MFQGDKKFGQSILHSQEDWLKQKLIPWVPSWLETNHLTLLSIVWSLLVVAFSYLARTNVHWLWAVCAMIIGQYITDLLDGAIGRLRNTGLVKWGFYMDHFLDFIFLCAMLIGYALLIPQAYRTNVFFIMTIFAGFMVHSFLSFAATNRFQIAYMGIGPTEIRIGFILANIGIILAGASIIVKVIPYVVVIAFFGLCVSVYRTQQDLWRIDMAAKKGVEVNIPPPSQHRKRFAICLVLAIAGFFCLWVPSAYSAVQTGAVIFFTSAITLLLVSVADLHRLRQTKRLFQSSLLVYGPYLIMALLLIGGLRVWLVLQPDQTIPMLPDQVGKKTMPALQQPKLQGTEEEILRAWDQYVQEEKKFKEYLEEYTGFLTIDAVAYPVAHKKAFENYYTAYLTLIRNHLELLQALSPEAEKIINAKQNNAIHHLRWETLSDRTILRIYSGGAYSKTLKMEKQFDEEIKELTKLWWKVLRKPS